MGEQQGIRKGFEHHAVHAPMLAFSEHRNGRDNSTGKLESTKPGEPG